MGNEVVWSDGMSMWTKLGGKGRIDVKETARERKVDRE